MFPHTTIVLDALDECEPSTREALLDSLVAVPSATTAPVKVFVTSRDDADLRRRFAARPDVYMRDGDIARCVLRGNLLDGDVSPELYARIVRALEAGANGMSVRLPGVCCSLADGAGSYGPRTICSEITAAHVERAMTELPKDLDEMYAAMMATMRTRRVAVAEEALMWILFAARPLAPHGAREACGGVRYPREPRRARRAPGRRAARAFLGAGGVPAAAV